MKKLLFIFTYFICLNSMFAQHEFFIRNIMVSVKNSSEIDGISSPTPTVYIRGSLENDSGILIDSGEIQITGNITFTNHSILQDSGEFVLLGARFRVASSYNSYKQIITGNFANAFVGDNAFHTIIIDKPNWTPSNDSRIRLGQNVEISKFLSWQSGGIITTDLVSHADIGEVYQYEMYVKNPDPNSLSGHMTTPGATNNYVVGKLRRQVDRIGDYYFPIGVEPDHGIGGMNACKVSFTSPPTNAGILAYLQKNGLQSILNPVLYGDIGTDPGASGGDFSTCIGGPDGILDRMIISKNQNYQWNLSSNLSGSFQYSIEIIPTINCAIASIGDNVPSSCNTPYAGRSMTWLACGGVPLGTPTTLINPLPLFSGFGYAVVPPMNYKIITDQVGFSTFRLHGATILGTVLPVELISFSLSTVDNDHFELDWKTASELNCKEFILERSTDGIHFTVVATVPCNGITSLPYDYFFNDYDVVANVTYYYRLRQVDDNNLYTFSEIRSGKLYRGNEFVVYPTLTTGLVTPTSKEFVSIFVYDALGQLVQTFSNQGKIDLSHFSNGSYILKIFFVDSTIKNIKIVKI